MKKIFLVSRREFLMTITRKSYLLSLIGAPLVLLTLGAILQYGVSSLKSGRGDVTVGVIDQAGVINFELAGAAQGMEEMSVAGVHPQGRHVRIKSCSNLTGGLLDLEGTRLDLLCLIEKDYLQSGRVQLYTRSIWINDSPAGLATFQSLLRASLAHRLKPDRGFNEGDLAGITERVITPIKLRRFASSDDGAVMEIGDKLERLKAFLVPYGLILSLMLSLFISASYLLRATAEEKENRVMEIMFSSVNPTQLFWGKILGLGGAALLQVITYLILVGGVIIYYGASPTITVGGLLLSLIYYLAGYALYAGLLVAIGVLGDNSQESSRLATPLNLILMTPVILEFLLIDEPNGMLARALSYAPLTAPVTMLYRLALTSIPVIDIVVSLCLLLGSAYLAVGGAARIFRAAALMYGKRFTLPELARWLREP